MAEDANEMKAQRVLDGVKNWTMGSKPMGRDEFQATVRYLIEELDEMVDDSDGWDFPDDSETEESNYGEAEED